MSLHKLLSSIHQDEALVETHHTSRRVSTTKPPSSTSPRRRAAPKLDFGSSFQSEASWLKVSMALSVMTVEARHASVVGLLNKPTPSNISPNGAFDKPMAAAEVLKVVEGTGFIQ